MQSFVASAVSRPGFAIRGICNGVDFAWYIRERSIASAALLLHALPDKGKAIGYANRDFF
jgi:hypothetical protein